MNRALYDANLGRLRQAVGRAKVGHTDRCRGVAGTGLFRPPAVGVWVDEGFDPKMPTLVVKAQSDAYFRLLRRRPQLKEVFRLGNHLVWVTPSGTALVVDTSAGQDRLADAEIDRLFVARK